MIETVGIIGSGKMGSDIFNYLSEFDFNLKWFILFDDEKEKLHKSFQKKINRKLKHNLITEEEFNLKNKYLFSTDLFQFNDCDLIIESIPEDINLKKELFSKLDYIVNNNCIFVSNSSSILPSKLSNKRVIAGMHFFFPVAFVNTVELIRHNGINDSTFNKLTDFLASINKDAFLQDETMAFLLNRFLLDIQLKAFDLVHSHDMDYIHFDHIVKDLIPDFGLFEMIDEVGLHTMYNAILNYSNMDANPNRFNGFLNEIKEKIEKDTPFCNVNGEKELKNDLVNYLKNDIKYYIITLIKDYSDKFNFDQDVFKNYIKDFCGIML